MSVDPRDFRRTMGLFATGVTVITARVGATIHGMTANAVTSVSLDPLLVLFCVDCRARMSGVIAESGRFAINILSEGQEALAAHFSGRSGEDAPIAFVEIDGVPALADNLATLVCTVDRGYDGGDHRVIFGRVDALTSASPDTLPLLYYAGGYRRLERQQRERIEALDRIGHAIASSLDVDEVFETFAAQAGQLLRHDAISVTLLSEDGGSLERFALSSITGIGPRVGECESLDETVAGLTVRGGRTVWTNDMAADERFRGANDLRWIAEGFRRFISTPLRARERVIGSLNVLRKGEEPYVEADALAAEQIANGVAIFLDNMRLHGQSRRLAVVEERNRIAREIHDTLVQSLTGIVHQLDMAEENRHDEARLRADLRQARVVARRALNEARRSVWDLHPRELEGRPLPEVLRDELEVWRGASGVAARLFVRGEGGLPLPIEIAILRITQEALRNVHKYARAHEARVELEYGAHDVRLSIGDDGVGFAPRAPATDDSPTGNGFGLIAMSARARAVGGRFSVSSWPGNGTRIEASFPRGAVERAAASPAATGQAALAARVIIVDDHALVRQGLVELVGRIEGLTVVGDVGDGYAAIDAVERLRPDLVLMDMRLPGIDGAATTKQVVEARPDLRVIMLTSSDDGDDLARAIEAGARGYILKEAPIAQLTETIRAVLRGEAVIERRVTRHLVERFSHLLRDRSHGDVLSERELEVLRLMVEGRRNREIAAALSLSEHTVKSHVGNIFQKLGVADRAAAVGVALQRNLGGLSTGRGSYPE